MPILQVHNLCSENLDRSALPQRCSESNAEASPPAAQCQGVVQVDLKDEDYLEG